MIYHITSIANWEKAKSLGYYEGETLASEGFLHASYEHQLKGVRERYYKHKKNLILLHIQEDKVDAEIKNEESPTLNERFPHIYGRLNLSAVINTTILEADD